MTKLADHAGLIAAVVADPDDSLPRLALADWHEERGEVLEAECWRWFATSGRRPFRGIRRGGMLHGQTVYWWYDDTDHHEYDTLARMTPAWCYSMVDSEEEPNRPHATIKCFRTPLSAYAAAVEAWCRLTDTQRRGAWQDMWLQLNRGTRKR